MTYAILWRWNGTAFKVQFVIDSFYSMVWTERWQDYGEASLTVDPGTPIRIGDYLTIPGRRMCARVTCIVEERNAMKISAEDSLALLDKRIITETVQDSQVQNFVRKMLVQDNIILTAGETATDRTIPVLALGDLTAITASARIQRSYQPVGETLLSLAKAYGFNPYATLSGGHIVINAEAVPDTPKPISAENALSGWGIGQEDTRANVCYVGGQIVGGTRAVVETGDTVSGLGRTEIFADRRDLPAEDMTWDALTSYYGVPDFTDISGTGNARVAPILSGTSAPYVLADMAVMVSCYSDNTHSRVVIGVCESLKSALSSADYATFTANVNLNNPPQQYHATFDGTILAANIGGIVRVSLSPDEFTWSITFYTEALESIGEQVLADQEPDGMTWAEIERMIPYEEYGLGDVIRAIWESGIRRDMRVSEIVESWDNQGYKATPTLEIL